MRQSDLPEEGRQRLRQARIDFPGYYGAATPADAEVMDQLVLAHAAYLATVHFRRAEVPEEFRRLAERVSFTVDQFFTYFREAVRSSQTFARMESAANGETLLSALVAELTGTPNNGNVAVPSATATAVDRPNHADVFLRIPWPSLNSKSPST